MRRFLNVMGIIFAVIFSFLLVIMCIVTPLFATVQSFLDADALTDYIVGAVQALATAPVEGDTGLAPIAAPIGGRILLGAASPFGSISVSDVLTVRNGTVYYLDGGEYKPLADLSAEEIAAYVGDGVYAAEEGTGNRVKITLDKDGNILLEAQVDAETVTLLRKMLEDNSIREVIASFLPDDIAAAERETAIDQAVGYIESIINKLIASPAVKEVLNLYTVDVVSAALGKGEEPHFTVDSVRRILTENEDELCDLIVSCLPADVEITKEQLHTVVQEFCDNGVEALVESLPSGEDLIKDADGDIADVQMALRIIANPVWLWLLIGITVLFAGIIYALRFPRFKGFLWLGIDAAIAAGWLAIIGFSGSIALNLIPMEGEVRATMSALVGVLTSPIRIDALILLGVAVVLIALFIVLRKLVVNKKKATDVPAEA